MHNRNNITPKKIIGLRQSRYKTTPGCNDTGEIHSR